VINFIVWWEDKKTGECGRFIFDHAFESDEFIAMTNLTVFDTEEDEECYCSARNWHECGCGNFKDDD